MTRTKIKSDIVRMLALLERKMNGNVCRICGSKPGILAYHLVPQRRGDATRFMFENIVWACRGCNWSERWNRSLYRQRHIVLFGKERIERIEAAANGIAKFSTDDLIKMLKNLNKAIYFTKAKL